MDFELMPLVLSSIHFFFEPNIVFSGDESRKIYLTTYCMMDTAEPDTAEPDEAFFISLAVVVNLQR